MRRTRGRLDVNELIGNYQKALKEGRIEKASECTTVSYWIKGMDGKKYLFKSFKDYNQMYRSSLVERIANAVNIKTCHVELASFGYIDGELIEDYRKDGFIYTPGSQILAEYYMYIKTKNMLEYQNLFPKSKVYKYSTDEVLSKMNNLKTIENALHYHYRNSTKKEEIVENMMKDLKKYFCLDILTMQIDRGHHNWEVEEAPDLNEAYLAPYSDMTSSFQMNSFNILLNPSPTSKGTPYQKLEEALEENDFEIFYELYIKNPTEQIEAYLKEIERNGSFYIESDIYNYILTIYYIHYGKLTELIERKKGYTR